MSSYGELVDLSLNEVELTAMKAARGAGFAWGMAEELGRSARWLAVRGIPWAAALLAVLDDPDATDPCHSGPLLGVMLADEPWVPNSVRLDQCMLLAPLWMLPPLAAVGALHGDRFAGQIGKWRFALDGGQLFISGQAPSEAEPRPVTLAPASTVPEGLVPLAARAGAGRGPIIAGEYERLEAYVFRTYVPNSEKSRLRGAGGFGMVQKT